MMTSKLHAIITQDAFPVGAWLRCEHPGCDRGERITSEDAAHYLAHGWPMHHGVTMTLTTEMPA
jgi:hypothetical protein